MDARKDWSSQDSAHGILPISTFSQGIYQLGQGALEIPAINKQGHVVDSLGDLVSKVGRSFRHAL